MGLLIQNLEVSNAIRAVRELIMDTSPVPFAQVRGQGFSFSKDSNSIVINGATYTFDEMQKIYEFMEEVREELDEDADIIVDPHFVGAEYAEGIQNFTHTFTAENEEYFQLKRKRYFSDQFILAMFEEFYLQYMSFNDSPAEVETIYLDLNYVEQRKLIFWLAYYLIDRKRMYFATAETMAEYSGEKAAESSKEYKNDTRTVTAKVGNVFTETIKEGGEASESSSNLEGLKGFTALWGDKYSYLAKLQLYIRDRFEKQFNDFSLRNDCLISSQITLERSWTPDTWLDTTHFSRSTLDLIQ